MRLRNFTAIVFLGLLLLQSLGTAVFFWWYALDLASFEQEFCENLDQPALECHGSCMIRDMWRVQPAKQEMRAADSWPSFPECIKIFNQIGPMVVRPSEGGFVSLFFHVERWHSSDYTADLLRPPSPLG